VLLKSAAAAAAVETSIYQTEADLTPDINYLC
jgi:hypothetical protein